MNKVCSQSISLTINLKLRLKKKSSDGSFAKVKTSDWNIVQMQLSKASMALILINKYVDTLPNSFITLHETNSIGSPNIGVVGFSYDYELERLSNNPQRYAPRIAKYKCICEPDFSMKIGDPLGVVVGNAFRSHSIAFCLQEYGCKVMPTMKWSSPESYEVCFDGYERGGAVIVSTIGTMKDERSRMYFKDGFKEMLKRISPDAVVLYGDNNEWIASLMPKQLDVQHFSHERFNRMRGYGK